MKEKVSKDGEFEELRRHIDAALKARQAQNSKSSEPGSIAEDLHHVCDALANGFQKLAEKSLFVFLILAILAILAFTTMGSLSVLSLQQKQLIYGLYLGFLLLSYLYYRFYSRTLPRKMLGFFEGKREDSNLKSRFTVQEKHMRFRILAEAFRIQAALWQAGYMNVNVSAFVPSIKIGLSWLPVLLKHYEEKIRKEGANPVAFNICSVQFCIRDQIEYYTKSFNRESKLDKKLTMIMNILLFLIVISSVGFLIAEHDVFNWLINGLPAFLGLTIAYREMRSIRTHLDEYTAMLGVYKESAKKLNELDEAALRSLVEKAMFEFSDWYHLRSTHPIQNM